MRMIVQPIEVRFTPVGQPLYFSAGLAANVLRGSLGLALKELSGHNAACKEVFEAVYERRAGEVGPSGFQDPPRPIVFRTEELEGREFRAGEEVRFRVHAFAPKLPVAEALERGFGVLSAVGIGRERTRFTGVSVRRAAEVTLDLGPAEPVGAMRVEFLTPTELKSGGVVLREPDFAVLFARARDRVSLLSATFQDGPFDLDFRRLGEAALEIKRASYRSRTLRAVRHSARTEQRHFLQGFVGTADYVGELTELAPILKACAWTGVGRQTIWGHGALHVECWALLPAQRQA